MLSDSALEKKRRFQAERTARLLDPRIRTLGVDKKALDEQIEEKKRLQQLESERNQFFDRQALMMDKHAQVLQHEVDTLRLQREREIVEYRNTYQKRLAAREYDLNDPEMKKKDVPMRTSDADPRCGPASMQAFEGEDLDHTERTRAQRDQLRRWAQQQIDEKLVKKHLEDTDNKFYEDRSEEMAFRTHQISQEIAGQRRQMAVTTAEFNKAVAEQKRREKMQSRFDDTQKNLEEIQNMLDSDLLREHGGTTGYQKGKRDFFKGFSPEEIQNIAADQARQREDLQSRRLRDTEDERQQAAHEAMENRMSLLLDRQRERERRERAQQLGQQHKVQSSEATLRKAQLDELYRNQIGEEFHRFGKSL